MRVVTFLALIVALCTICPRAGGQHVPATQPTTQAAAQDHPRDGLTGRMNGRDAVLALRSADVRVIIDRFLAETSFTLTVHNPHTARAEATLIFDVPRGSTVNGFTLDVNGNSVDGVAVEREHARNIFRQETERRVDPGLVEHVSGNTYSVRVFPIEPGGDRTFGIRYVSELSVSDGNAVYEMPFDWQEHAETCHVSVKALGLANPPGVQGAFNGLKFERSGAEFVGDKKFADFLPGNLRLTFPSPGASVAVGKGPAYLPANIAPTGEQGFYFAITDTPSLPESTFPTASKRPVRIGILWDAGILHSLNGRMREIGLLRKMLAPLGEVNVDLVLFRDAMEKPASYAIHNGDTSILEKALNAVVYDGATRLASLSFPKQIAQLSGAAENPNLPNLDCWLLFTDGMCLVGPDSTATPQVPVFAVCDGAALSRTLMSRLAASSGGALLDGVRMNDAQLVELFRHGQAAMSSVEYNPAEVCDITPGGAVPVGGSVTVAGRLLVPEAKIVLHYRRGPAEREQTFNLRQAEAGPSNLAMSIWANHRAMDLSDAPFRNNAELLRLGYFFNLVTPATSLLVLETVDQYVRHDVAPPVGMPELRKEYFARMDLRHKASEEAEFARREPVLAAWNQRVAWWEKIYSYPDNYRYGAARDGGAGEFGDAPSFSLNAGGANNAGAAPGPAAAPMPPDVHVQVRDPGSSGHRAAGGDAIAQADPWRQDPSYVEAMRVVPRKDAYRVYLARRRMFADSIPFYLDCSDYLARYCDHLQGVRALTDAIAAQPDDPALLRVAARRLDRMGEHDLAVDLFETLVAVDYDNPQSYRDLALAMEESGDRAAASKSKAVQAQAMGFYQRAMDLLNRVASRQWTRSPGIQIIAITEAGGILSKARKLDPFARWPLDVRYGSPLEMDLRIVLTWDTDAKLQLNVMEPSGETADSRTTTIGGLLFADVNDGFGPQEYCLRKRMAGKYVIKVTGGSEKSRFGTTDVQAVVITDFGRESEKRQVMSVRLNDKRDSVELGSVTLDPR